MSWGQDSKVNFLFECSVLETGEQKKGKYRTSEIKMRRLHWKKVEFREPYKHSVGFTIPIDYTWSAATGDCGTENEH